MPSLSHWLSVVFSHPSFPFTLAIAAKTALIYVFLVVGIRLLGTRALGEMSVYDFVLIVVISNAVQNALVGGDITLAGGIVSALTLLVINRIFTWLLTNSDWLEDVMVGEPVVLIGDGRILWNQMSRQGVDYEELMAALRGHGITDAAEVRLAVLEIDGTISVVPINATVYRTHHRVRGLRTT